MSVQLALLGFLLERDYHGYDLKKTIERLMGKWTDIRFGSIYHALSVLEKAGHVRKVATIRSGGKPARSVFSITDSGKAEFQNLLRDNLTNIRQVYLTDDMGIFFAKHMEPSILAELLKNRLKSLQDLAAMLAGYRSKNPDFGECRESIAGLLISRHINLINTDCQWYERFISAVEENRF